MDSVVNKRNSEAACRMNIFASHPQMNWRNNLYQFLCHCFVFISAPYVKVNSNNFLHRIGAVIKLYLSDMLLVGRELQEWNSTRPRYSNYSSLRARFCNKLEKVDNKLKKLDYLTSLEKISKFSVSILIKVLKYLPYD